MFPIQNVQFQKENKGQRRRRPAVNNIFRQTGVSPQSVTVRPNVQGTDTFPVPPSPTTCLTLAVTLCPSWLHEEKEQASNPFIQPGSPRRSTASEAGFF